MLLLIQNMSGTWRSLVARCTGGAEAAGSNPVVPTIFFQKVMLIMMGVPFVSISEAQGRRVR